MSQSHLTSHARLGSLRHTEGSADQVYQALLTPKEATTHAPPAQQCTTAVFEHTIANWSLAEGAGEHLTSAQKQPFHIKVTLHSNRLEINVATVTSVAEVPRPGLDMYIEIDAGLPCVHVSGPVSDDVGASVFGHQEGLRVRPGSEHAMSMVDEYYDPAGRRFSGVDLDPLHGPRG